MPIFTTMDSSTQNNQPVASRPKFLTILCYLTMFASSWIMINSLTALMNPEQVSLAFSKELQKVQQDANALLAPRSKVMTQLQENELVNKEFELLDDDAVIYKMKK